MVCILLLLSMHKINIPLFFFLKKNIIEPLMNCFFHLTKLSTSLNYSIVNAMWIVSVLGYLCKLLATHELRIFLLLTFVLQPKATEVLAPLHFWIRTCILLWLFPPETYLITVRFFLGSTVQVPCIKFSTTVLFWGCRAWIRISDLSF